MRKVPTMECPHCEGLGKVELPVHLADTLRMIPKNGFVTTEALSKQTGLTQNALANRLVDLFMLGFVSRPKQRVNKFWHYTRIK